MPLNRVLTYQKVCAFIQLFVQWHLSRLKGEDNSNSREKTPLKKVPLEEFQISVKKRVTWKRVAFVDALIHTVFGFLIVATVLYVVPEVMNDATRLTVFWGVTCTHLILGFFALISLSGNSFRILKLVAGALIVLQITILGMTSNIRAHCLTADNLLTEDCDNLIFLSSHVILPNFLHSFIFSGILIIFLVQQSALEEEDNYDFDLIKEKVKMKQCYQFAHITVIVEEVV